jgi:hypothetical protein
MCADIPAEKETTKIQKFGEESQEPVIWPNRRKKESRNNRELRTSIPQEIDKFPKPLSHFPIIQIFVLTRKLEVGFEFLPCL